ncbi:uncharacterized protein G2W53_021903 [Senna tora]|uniref:Uncharacterized protein n=1 Tax=Senna tora TaxID=362788 RepID=A0A834WNS4_9FABA|nr:uncharacterized protein G2W53_021903 [Senna tora]
MKKYKSNALLHESNQSLGVEFGNPCGLSARMGS